MWYKFSFYLLVDLSNNLSNINSRQFLVCTRIVRRTLWVWNIPEWFPSDSTSIYTSWLKNCGQMSVRLLWILTVLVYTRAGWRIVVRWVYGYCEFWPAARDLARKTYFLDRQKFQGRIFNFDFLGVIIKCFPNKPSSITWLKSKLPFLTQNGIKCSCYNKDLK